MDISGEPYPGSEQADNVTQTIYGGSQAAFDASKPVNIFAANPGAYAGMTAAFTAGGDDPDYEQAAETVSPRRRPREWPSPTTSSPARGTQATH